jgi:hypothetical protein
MQRMRDSRLGAFGASERVDEFVGTDQRDMSRLRAGVAQPGDGHLLGQHALTSAAMRHGRPDDARAAIDGWTP